MLSPKEQDLNQYLQVSYKRSQENPIMLQYWCCNM